MVDGVVDRLRDVEVQCNAARPHHLKWHEAAGEARADAADAVVRPGGCRSGNSGSVPVGGRRIGVVVDEVVALKDRTREVRMCGVDTRVDDRDDDLRRACGDLPRGGEVQRGVRRMGRVRIAGKQGARAPHENATADGDRGDHRTTYGRLLHCPEGSAGGTALRET